MPDILRLHHWVIIARLGNHEEDRFGRAEQAFFRTLAAGEGPVRWADVAADTGYADQSHLCRETRRVTGFPPEELRRLIHEDERFWIYRVWV